MSLDNYSEKLLRYEEEEIRWNAERATQNRIYSEELLAKQT